MIKSNLSGLQPKTVAGIVASCLRKDGFKHVEVAVDAPTVRILAGANISGTDFKEECKVAERLLDAAGVKELGHLIEIYLYYFAKESGLVPGKSSMVEVKRRPDGHGFQYSMTILQNL